jgi:hypothetical protein
MLKTLRAFGIRALQRRSPTFEMEARNPKGAPESASFGI